MTGVFNFVRSRLYVNETIILLQHRTQTSQTSQAEVVYADEGNVSDVLRFDPRRNVRIFREFLSRGDRGYFAYLNGVCVFRMWIEHGPRTVYLHPLVSMGLRENEVFIHSGKTAPEARGKNVFPHALCRAVEDFRGSAIFVSVMERNSASLRGLTKAGFAPIEKMRLVVFLGIIRSFAIEFCT